MCPISKEKNKKSRRMPDLVEGSMKIKVVSIKRIMPEKTDKTKF